jgi:hypothetical protein
MSSYLIQSAAVNKNRVFILQISEVVKRLYPFYYIPELVELEKKKFSRLLRLHRALFLITNQLL